MDDIAELQRQFAAVQKADTTNRLSERNCIEIVMKLVELKLLDVMFTQTGREYLTPQQLENEIKDELLMRGGRVSTTDIQPVVNVDLSYVEAKAVEVVAGDPETTMIGTEMITEWYLDAIAEEINDTLQEEGKTTIGTVATRFSLPVDFTAAALRKRISTTSGALEDGKPIIQAELRGSTLYTPAFVAREQASIRGAFSGVTRPTSVAGVAGRLQLSMEAVERALTPLLQQHQLPGTLRGGEYVPHVFLAYQRRALSAHFSANGVLSLARARQLGFGGGSSAGGGGGGGRGEGGGGGSKSQTQGLMKQLVGLLLQAAR